MRRDRAVTKAETPTESQERRKDLPPPAQRALAEAEARRNEAARRPAPPEEIGGRGGPDPARYGDWEVNGIASDF
ncbi:MAG: DUF1674 domain-containing protein [Alphaproteobacteria bacterium]|nr:DUF1674 domain-containing protein [Alphaproteobacteria bacterium]